jgi:hypothetical protein
VAHGMNTRANYAKSFSNERHSNQSSLGFFLTGEPYDGDRGYSLKLYGLEKNFNDNAFARGVIMHGASYVREKFIKQNGRLGRSFGCTAVSEEINSMIIQTIKNGTCLFSACKKTQCWIRKRQVRGLRRQKKRSLLFVNEHFSDKRNEEIGVFLPTLFIYFPDKYYMSRSELITQKE